jgi:4-amino-4-deoxy-L-arabinose transferase-like glycosyltransferase
VTHALELAALVAVVAAFLAIVVRDLDSWRFAFIGDEGVFYDHAQQIIRGERVNWFSQRAGAYAEHPVLTSAYQALTMKVFGSEYFGWKMASVIAIAITLPSFYWLLRETLGPRVAVFGTLFLGASHYLYAYAHTGYDNIFSLFPTTAALALMASGLKRSSYALLFAAGVCAGMGFYTYYSSRATMAIIAVALLCLGRRGLRPGVIAAIGAGFVVFVLPLFAVDQWEVIDRMLDRSASNSDDPLIKRLAGNLPRTLFPFNFQRSNQHYVAGALMDSVSVTFAVAGFALALRRIRDEGHRRLLIWYAGAATVVGLLYNEEFVAISRLHYALPPIAAFSAVALDRLVAAAAVAVRRPQIEWTLTAGTLAVMAPLLFVVNVQHFTGYSAHRFPTIPETVILREFRSDVCDGQPLRNVAYTRAPDSVLNGLWKFLGRGDDKALMIAFQDIERGAYQPYPQSGGVGCVAVSEPVSTDAAPLVARLMALETPNARIVTDMARFERVLFVPPNPGALDASVPAAMWRTDFTLRDGLARVVKGQERDPLPPIGAPVFVEAAALNLAGEEQVISVTAGDEARAYPLRTLIWHGVVHDTLDGVPIAVTYDAIAGSPRVYRRDLAGSTLDFGVTGMLRDGNALLFDRETETWWQQSTGRAVTGKRAGATLEPAQFAVSSWDEFRFTFPEGRVLRGPMKDYAWQPYLGYDVKHGRPIFTVAPVDDRLEPMRRVAVVETAGGMLAVAAPGDGARGHFAHLVEGPDGRRIAVFYDARARSALEARIAGTGRFVGVFGAYVAEREGQPLSFVIEGDARDRIIDEQTRTRWNVLGRGVDGLGTGVVLEPVHIEEGFWFAMAAAYPGIEIVEP